MINYRILIIVFQTLYRIVSYELIETSFKLIETIESLKLNMNEN